MTLKESTSLSKGRLVAIILGVVIVLALRVGIPWACAGNTAVGATDKYTLVYQSGPLDGRKYIKQMPPGTGRFWKGNLNTIYKYPATQRTYIISSKENVGDMKVADELVVNVKGANKVYLNLQLVFTLVPENLKQFHEKLGMKYGAWTDSGWDTMLLEQVRQPLETAFQEEGKQYTNIEACNEIGMTAMGDAVSAVIQRRIDSSMGGYYINVMGLSLTAAHPDPTVQAEIEKIAAAQQSVQTAEYNKHKLPYEVVDLSQGDKVPKLEKGFQSVISLGGPMNVYEEEKYRFLRDEDILLKRIAEEEVPFLGICLGAQLIAKATGARVIKNPEKEIGWYKIVLNDHGLKDDLFKDLPEVFQVFQWHADPFSIPPGGRRLAFSELCQNQTLKYGRNIYGIQFHVEITKDMIVRCSETYK